MVAVSGSIGADSVELVADGVVNEVGDQRELGVERLVDCVEEEGPMQAAFDLEDARADQRGEFLSGLSVQVVFIVADWGWEVLDAVRGLLEVHYKR